AVYEGLRPEHYFYDSIEKYSEQIKKTEIKDLYSLMAKTDVYISNLLLGLWHDKVLGRTNPKEVLGMKYTLPYPNHPEFQLFDILNKKDGRKKMAKYHPKDPDFWKLKSMLKEAYSFTDGNETFIDTTGIRKVKAGD